MTHRARIKYTAEQKAEMWDRWKRVHNAGVTGSSPVVATIY